MTKKLLNTKILEFAKKLKAINLLGGKCEICGDVDFFHMCFHHIDPNKKECEINKMINKNWMKIEKELFKCKLLCRNCHSELHFREQKSKRNRNNKKLFLEIKNVNCCEICGYDKSNTSLSFHHLEEKYIKFSKINVEFKSINEIEENIIEELNTCQVLCLNCHTKLHSDVEFFNQHKDEIIKKSENLIKKQPKLDSELIKKMYFEDKMKQVDIAKHFNTNKSTISIIIKKLKMVL